MNRPNGPAPVESAPGVVRRLWTSDPMLRIGVLPFDLLGSMLITVGRLSRAVERERAALRG